MSTTGSNFGKLVNSGIASVPTKPRGRNPSQAGIDEVNHAGKKTAATAFDDVQSVLDGNATARPARQSSGNFDICDTIVPGNQLPNPSYPAVSMDISPNSWGEGLNSSTTPQVTPVPNNSFITIAQFNRQRNRLVIQNVGTTNIYIIFGNAQTVNGNTATTYHLRIAAGDTYMDDSWQGRVDVSSDGSGGSVSVNEMTRSLNVSQ